MNRTCSKCKTMHELTAQHFYKSSRDKQGFMTWCKSCSNKAVAKWMQAKDAKKAHSAHCRAYMQKRREYHYKHLDALQTCKDCHEVKALREYTACHSVCRPCDRARRAKARNK